MRAEIYGGGGMLECLFWHICDIRGLALNARLTPASGNVGCCAGIVRKHPSSEISANLSNTCEPVSYCVRHLLKRGVRLACAQRSRMQGSTPAPALRTGSRLMSKPLYMP